MNMRDQSLKYETDIITFSNYHCIISSSVLFLLDDRDRFWRYRSDQHSRP
jgi:hypothetical protein